MVKTGPCSAVTCAVLVCPLSAWVPCLMGRKVAPPPNVHAALASFFGEDVVLVKVIEHSLFCRLHFRATATTRRRRIYLRGSAESFFNDPTLMLHEYCHVLRQWEPGLL